MRQQPIPVVLAAMAVLALCGGPAHGHGDVHMRIVQVTGDIGKHPNDASLRVSRGLLHVQHDEYDEALADFAEAERLGYSTIELMLPRGRCLLAAGRWEQAATLADAYLRAHPDAIEGLMLRALVASAGGRHRNAAEDLERMIQHLEEPSADCFVMLADELAAGGDTRRALQVLEAGVARVGKVPTLDLRAVTLARAAGLSEDALAATDRLIAGSPRSERWLALKADILADSGQKGEALAVYRAALAAVDQLPPRHRCTQAIDELVRNVHAAISAMTDPKGESR